MRPMNLNLKKLVNTTRRHPVPWGIAWMVALGIIDIITGYELAFSLFYVIPIALYAWTFGRVAGLTISTISAFVWLFADIASDHPHSHPLIPAWNTLIRLAFFLIITELLSALRTALKKERKLARTDNLTSAVNRRHFQELAQMEVDRLERYGRPFSLAYIDLDHFKTVNDTMGHAVGDELLRTVVSTMRRSVRKTDTVARLGGDEFALLLPEADEFEVRVVMEKIRMVMTAELQARNWPVTLSCGVLTCRTPPASTDELLRLVDELMYQVKLQSRNDIRYSLLDRKKEKTGARNGDPKKSI